MSNVQVRTERRRRLAELDDLLNELEWLNLAERNVVPQDLAARLEHLGVRASVKKDPFALIEAVFRLQRPFLRPNPSEVRADAVASARRAAPAGWLFV